MKWEFNEPVLGDIVRIKLGNIYHFGIFVSDDEIIQFGLPPRDLNRDSSKVEVCTTNLDVFLCGGFLEVGVPDKKEKKKMLPKDQIVEIAKSRIGEKGYHILYNNCEHFVFQCAFNEKVSKQVEQVREMFRQFPFVNIFIKKFPFKTNNDCIFPKERQEEIEKCGSEKVRQEKFYSWKLLEMGIFQSLGLDIKDVKFSRENNKWTCDKMCFSISHSQNLVAVAVARNEVGIDIEEINLERFKKFPAEKILTEEERKQKDSIPLELNLLWTAKEAIFKKGENKNFIPYKINTLDEKFITKTLKVDDLEFALSIATNDNLYIKFYLDEDIILLS